jgi:membrane-associated phospholipid phosphatase
MRIKDWIIAVFLLSAGTAYGQQTDTLVKKLDSLQKIESKTKPRNDVDKDEYTSQTNITAKAYFILLGTDFVQEVKSPFHASTKTWIKAGEFALLEGAMFFADKPIQKFATKFMAGNPGFKNTSQYITNFGASYEAYVLVAFAAYGILFKSNKVKTTTLLATQAYIVSGAMSGVVKYVTGRTRPNFNNDPQNNVFLGPAIFNGNKPGSGFGSSFPSGHTTAAFSAATVFAYEYKDQILIPVIAYTAAGLVGASRITQNAHWATDVLAGFALGYITGKQVVNNYHRYARLRTGQPKVSYQFNLEYNNGVIMPGMVCKF